MLEERPNYCVCTTFPALCQYSDKSYLKIIFENHIPTNHIWKSYLKIIFRQIIFRRDFLCHNRNSFIFELVRETPPEFFSEKLEILQHKFWIPIFFLPPDFICQIHNQIWKKSVKIILGEPHFFIRECTFISISEHYTFEWSANFRMGVKVVPWDSERHSQLRAVASSAV